MKTGFNKAMLAMLAPLALTACGDPPLAPHTHKTTDGIKPDAGYNWKTPSSNDVVWQPGYENLDHPHIQAGLIEGQWDADAGYALTVQGSMNAIWVPGSINSKYPHITAATDQDQWNADAGYSFVDAQKGLSVKKDPQLRPVLRGKQTIPELR